MKVNVLITSCKRSEAYGSTQISEICLNQRSASAKGRTYLTVVLPRQAKICQCICRRSPLRFNLHGYENPAFQATCKDKINFVRLP